MVVTGMMNPHGLLHAGLSLAARLLTPHVVLMESINSLLKRVVNESPNISLELLSARVSLKKHVGFASETEYGQELRRQTAANNQTERLQNPWKTDAKNVWSLAKRAQPRMSQTKTFKEIKPFAVDLSMRLLPLLQDAVCFVRRIDRWTCPPPVRHIDCPNPLMLNMCDRPFSALPQRERRVVTLASVFHRTWFRDLKENFVGCLSLLAFCEESARHRMRTKRSLLDDAIRVFVVGEIHSWQASCRGGATCTCGFGWGSIACMYDTSHQARNRNLQP